MQERRTKGLCFNGDEKWTQGHTCQAKKVFLLQLIPDIEDYDVVEQEFITEQEEELCQTLGSTPLISPQSISGLTTPA